MKKINLILISTEGCAHCHRFKEFWKEAGKDWPEVTYKEIDATTPEAQPLLQKHMIMASPGIVINDELFATGGFDEDAFLEKLKELS